MSYEPTEWKSGDVISSAKLNKMEQGIAAGGTGGGGFVVNLVADSGEGTWTCDKTWKEISDASKTMPVVIRCEISEGYVEYYPLMSVSLPSPVSQEYEIGYLMVGDDVQIVVASTDSENGYPVQTND